MNRRLAVNPLLGSIFGALLLAGTGCAPELGEEELGRVEYRMPSESEIGRKYELPDLAPEAASGAVEDGEDAPAPE